MVNSHIIGNPDSSIWKMLGVDNSKTTNTKQKSINTTKKNTENKKTESIINDKDDEIQK